MRKVLDWENKVKKDFFLIILNFNEFCLFRSGI